MEELSEKCNKYLEYRKEPIRNEECNKWYKNTLDGIKRRLGDAEEWSSDLESRIVKLTQSEQQKEEFFEMSRV